MGGKDVKYYALMRKDEMFGIAQIRDDGVLLSYRILDGQIDLAPLQYRTRKDTWIQDWWKDRSVPIGQGYIKGFLQKNGYNIPEEYLLKNLGLSLTDYYWIKPIDSALKWKDVNLYDNDFHDNILLYDSRTEMGSIPPHYSPNSSLQGMIEKTWSIIDGGRCLIKGNHSTLSTESLNEVFACMIHKRQGYKDYTDYQLLKIAHKPYDYGCVSRAFTSQALELVSAYALFTSEKQSNNTNAYEHFIKTCVRGGLDEDYIRHHLEYQILVDYVMSGYDRHLNNIGVLRDAETLNLVKIAPIYDSGAALFTQIAIPTNLKELQNMETHGFANRESKLLKLVRDKNALDLTKLPAASELKKLYDLDSHLSEKDKNRICTWYERKINMCRAFQLGKDIAPVFTMINKKAIDQNDSKLQEKRDYFLRKANKFEMDAAQIGAFSDTLAKQYRDAASAIRRSLGGDVKNLAEALVEIERSENAMIKEAVEKYEAINLMRTHNRGEIIR